MYRKVIGLLAAIQSGQSAKQRIDSRWRFRSAVNRQPKYEIGYIAELILFGFDSFAASYRHATLTNYRFQSPKTTSLMDCSTGASLDSHCATTLPHDTKSGWQYFVGT